MRPAPRLFTLGSPAGLTVGLTDFGARLTRIDAPDRAGRNARVLLGFDDAAAYCDEAAADGGAYLGATCGRVANRIAGAAYTIDGVRYPLRANEGAHQRHGGPTGFDRAIWAVTEARGDRIVMRHRSPDGDQGHPGTLDVTACFTLSANDTLDIDYAATTSRATHVNLVSHGYFNLSGRAGTTIGDHRLRIAADTVLPIDADQLPGAPCAVAGTPFDFTRPRDLAEMLAADAPQLRLGRGFNHNFCLTGAGLRDVAWLEHPDSGRTLTVATDQPGLQLYTGGWLGGAFGPRAGLCLEAQGWPDACNRPDFPPTRLDPGGVYQSRTRLRFGISK